MPYSTCKPLFSNTELNAVEAHGVATGLLCVNSQCKPAAWLAELNQPLSDTTTALLLVLFKNTRESLAAQDFAFALFLPDDDAPLSERLTALVFWCQGFLLGVGMNGASQNQSSEVREILKDVVEFTKLDTASDGDEEDEQAYAEICEYLRAVVLSLAGIFSVH